MKFDFIVHSDVSPELMLEIIALKSKQWHYSVEQHLKWIDENILPDDIHVIMSDKEENLAYMNLVKISVSINNISLPFLGIGNVCAKEKGRGYGKNILIGVNNYLVTNKLYGILLCKNDLIDFYKKYNWNLIPKQNIKNEKYQEINIMIFNLDQKVDAFDYTGRNF